MDWFKRYGIPGAYSMGLTLVWLGILYPCKIDLSDEKTLKVLGGIFAGGFLPFGYLMCMLGNAWYFFTCCLFPRCGRHARAKEMADFQQNTKPSTIDGWARWAAGGSGHVKNRFAKRLIRTSLDSETVLAACSVLEAVSRDFNSDTGKDSNLDKEKFVQEWIRKRTDIVVMNHAIIAGTIVCTGGVLFLGSLTDWSWQPLDLIWLLVPLLVLLFLTILYVTSVVRIGIDIAIAGVFNLRRSSQSSGGTGTPTGQGGTGTPAGQNNNTNQAEQSEDV